MPGRIDMRREHLLRERAFRDRETVFDATIHWFVYDITESSMHDVYDVSGEKKFKKRANVPLLWWFDEEGGDRITAEGRTIVRTLDFAVTVAALRNAGVDPEPDDRINDLVLWQGWYWEISEFTLTSQSSMTDPTTEDVGDDSTVRVRAYRRFPETDMPFDHFPGDG